MTTKFLSDPQLEGMATRLLRRYHSLYERSPVLQCPWSAFWKTSSTSAFFGTTYLSLRISPFSLHLILVRRPSSSTNPDARS